uniref:Family with sequence similarity 110 member D n=1 Tax=Erpetoichthys calabaricus TaxID=27687 RepID=A0A8C4TIE5_ERPCA
MKPLTPIGSPSPLRLLNKGPEYLRRQMDSGSRARSVSAVERLEADKAKYVKSQQVINNKQEPVVIPCATPPPQPRRPFTVPCATPPPPPRRPFTVPYDTPLLQLRKPFFFEDSDIFEDLTAKKENRVLLQQNEKNSPITPTDQTVPVMRRTSAKRMLRPDSLIIYRQKRECKTPNSETKGYSFVRRLFQGSMREKNHPEIPKMPIVEVKVPAKEEDSRMSWTNEKEVSKSDQEDRRILESPPGSPLIRSSEQVSKTTSGTEADKPAILRRRGLQRSKSDLRLRYSLALSEKERFFNYCGLDLEMVDRLGLENFFIANSDTVSLILRSVSVDGSEMSEFSRRSGEGLFEEELTEQIPSVVSVIERNARVIKWLYGCRKAKETPKESTV